MSGCESGVQTIGPSNELTGLVRSMMYAGARSVIVSLWPVLDVAASQLMATFYRRLSTTVDGRKMGIAASLRDAAVALRKDRSNLLHWAPFVLVGDWR